MLLLSAITVFTISSCSDQAQLQVLDEDASILAFGDSLTYGTGTSRDKAYPAVLQTLIKRKVINAGIPGEISARGLARLPALLEQYQPQLLIICHGGNDILRKTKTETISNNIQQMIELARQKNTQVMLIGVPEFGLFLNTSPLYRQLAEKNKLPIAEDILGDILSKPSLKSDNVHPNTKGYQLLAEEIAEQLKQSGAIE